MKGTAHENLKVLTHILAADVGATTTNGTGVDTAGFQEALFIVNHGTVTTTNDITLQESADNSSFADVPDSEGDFVQIVPGNDDTTFLCRANVRSRKRYLRLSAVSVGAATLIASNVILSSADLPPVTQEEAVINVT